ncbi:MAG: hypothetical protein GYA87_02060 [Christensenellaceae bacterium]|nr:hypothetical protein [Christensenellaceae bacterium]
MAVLGIDLGTTACKVCAYDNSGNLLAKARDEYKIISKKPGWAELDPIQLKKSVFNTIKRISSLINEPIFSISFSSQGEGIVPMNNNYEPIGNIILSYDNRSKAQAEYIENGFGKENYFNITGQIINSAVSASKIMWIMENTDYYNSKPQKFCCVGDYLISCFGLKPAIDCSLAARTGCFDVHNLCWNSDILSKIFINENMLSNVQTAGSVAGYVGLDLSSALGLSKGTAIVVGGHDQPCGHYGVCGERFNESYYSLGTTETCVCTFDNFMPELFNLGLPCYPHIVQNKYVTLPGNYTGGILLNWYKDQFFISTNNNDPYDEIIDYMSNNPTKILVLPHFTSTGSPYNDDNSSGAIMGLKLSTTKGEFVRALIEGVTMEIKLNLELLKSIDINVDSLVAAGTSTKSKKIMQLKADVLNKLIYVNDSGEAAAAGAGMLALKGLGIEPRYNVSHINEYKPNEENSAFYNEQFGKYKKIYPAVKAIL